MNILLIDTASNQEIKVGLKIDKKTYWVKKPVDKQRAQVVLPMVDTLVKKHGVTVKDIKAIEVAVGPGSFTGLRVGIAVANTLGFALDIPVNGKKQIVVPSYTS